MKEIAKKLVSKHLNVETSDVTPLHGGQVGNVFRCGDYVVKFVEACEEAPFTEENVDDRVYGSRWSNLQAARSLLEESDIPTPKLYASGTLQDEDVHYAIFGYVAGDTPDYSPEYFTALGKALADIHSITRTYQGWVSQGEPYKEAWNVLFSESIHSQLAQSKDFLAPTLYANVKKYIESKLQDFKAPDFFVLSHTDGIQAEFKKQGKEWALQGVIDVEDYQFTDQRFVLAGVELVNEMQGHPLPQAFWDAYSAPVDVSYEEFRNLFQVYYLLVWIRVLQEQDDLVAQNIETLKTKLT